MIRVGVFGASGYGGVGLCQGLANHPEVELTYLGGHTTAGQRLSDVYPHLRGVLDMPIEEASTEAAIERCDLLFYILEQGMAPEWIRKALEAGKRVFDASADFRLHSQGTYEAHYGPHPAPELLSRAVYGLPELHRDEIAKADLVAMPGCYPTSAILALAPLVAHGRVDLATLIVDSKSGISGAGRTKYGRVTHFCEVSEAVEPYSVARHRHAPEMDQELSGLAGAAVQVTFTPHLVPMVRGLLTTAYADLREAATADELVALYEEYYADEPFVSVLPAGQFPSSKHVAGTNRCVLGMTVHTAANRVVVASAIDNLRKGHAAGAGLQCLNCMYGFEESTGLLQAAVWP